MKAILFFLSIILSSCSTTEKILPGFLDIVPDFIENYFKDEVKPYSVLPSFDSKVNIKKVWENKLPGEIEELYSFLSIYKFDDQIFIPTNEQSIYIIDSETGEIKKKLQTNLNIFSGLVVDSSLLYFGSREDTVTAINYSNETVLWQRLMSSEVLSISKVIDNAIYVRTNDSKVTAINVITGEFLWINSQIPSELSIRGASQPLLYEDKVFVGFEEGKIVSYSSSNGDITWQAQLPALETETIIDRLNDIDGTMIIEDSILYAISYQGSIAAIDTFSGQILWSRQASSINGIDIFDNNIFFIDDDGILWCLDKFSGKPIWKQEELHKRLVGSPIFFNGYIIANGIENYLHIFDYREGKIVGRLNMENSVQSIFLDYDALYLLDKDFSAAKYEITEIIDNTDDADSTENTENTENIEE